MLILTRQIGEEIVIGEAIRVEVLGIKQGQVRLGIKAPRQCKVLRAELIDHPRSGQNGSRSPAGTDRSAGDTPAAPEPADPPTPDTA